jgi:hypothetical protein
VITTTRNPGCAICSSPTGDEAWLCRQHTDALVRDLADVPDLVDQLEVAYTRQDRLGADSEGGGRSQHAPLPWNERIVTERHALNAILNGWARLLGVPVAIHYSDSATLGAWLASRGDVIRHRPDAGEAYSELTDAIRSARRAIDRPAELAPYGPCLYAGELGDQAPTEPCPAYLYGRPDRPVVVCRRCGAQHDTAKRRAWMLQQTESMIGTVSEVVGYLKVAGIEVTVDAVHAMARPDRRRIEAVGQDSRGHALYRFSDVAAAVGDRYKRRSRERVSC